VKLTYCLAQETRNRAFIETGATIETKQSVELPADALTPELRAHILRRTNTPALPATLELLTYKIGFVYEQYRVSRDEPLTLDAAAGDDAAPRLLAEDAARYDAAQAARLARIDADIDERIVEVQRLFAALWNIDPKTAAVHQLPRITTRPGRTPDRIAIEPESVPTGRPRSDELSALVAQYNAAAVAARDAFGQAERERAEAAAVAKSAREAERVAWIAAHGSDYLKRCESGGYNCQRQYALERAKAERPGYVLDYNDAAEWKDRSGPSEAALIEAAHVGGFVVWLTTPPSSAVARDDAEDDGDDGFESCEAVVIADFLGQYDLIRMF
jgi:hypothetical protein